MTVIISDLDIRCAWNGLLTGILLKNSSFNGKTRKIIGIHGWQDNLNSMLSLAKRLVGRHHDFEMYLYDRAGHGFSSHYPKGIEYTDQHNIIDLRMVIQTLGWDKEHYIIIGHSYGAIFGMIYTACYSKEIQCFVAIDCLAREQLLLDMFYTVNGENIDKNFDFYRRLKENSKDDLTFNKAVEIIKTTRAGISDDAAKLLTERSVRYQTTDNKIYFTRDRALNIKPIYPYTADVIESAIKSIKSPVLFIGTSSTLWPKPYKTIDLLKQYNPNFELTWFEGSHHIQMDKVDEISDRIEQYLEKHVLQSFVNENSKL